MQDFSEHSVDHIVPVSKISDKEKRIDFSNANSIGNLVLVVKKTNNFKTSSVESLVDISTGSIRLENLDPLELITVRQKEIVIAACQIWKLEVKNAR